MSARLMVPMSAESARSFLLTNWATVRGSSSVVSVTQDAGEWLDASQFAEMTFYIDVSEVSQPSTGLLLLYLETSATMDETGFLAQPLVGPIPITASTTSPIIAKTASAGGSPLCRYVRWRLFPTVLNPWDVTMRIRAVGNRTTYFAPTQLGGCVFWARADRGLGFTGTTISTWADQSGVVDSHKLLTSQGATFPTLTFADSGYANQSSILFTRASSTYMTSGVWASAVNQPNTWVVVGNTGAITLGEAVLDANDMSTGQNIGRNPGNQISIASAGTALTWANNWNTSSAVLAEFNGVSSNIFYNDFTTAKVTGNAGSGPTSGQGSLTVGSSNAAWGPGNYWGGPVAEIIGFTGILTTTQRALLRKYLNNRYGLSIV
jgi:hypothetical protein